MNVKETLASYKIPKRAVSDLCNIHSSELSAYLRRRENVSAAKALRIEQAVADITLVFDRLAKVEIPFSPNLRDIPALKKMIEVCKAHSDQTEELSAKRIAKQILKQLSRNMPGLLVKQEDVKI